MTKNYTQKVLSVDDIKSNNFLISSCLELGGIETILAYLVGNEAERMMSNLKLD